MPPPNTPEEGLLDTHTPLALTPFTRSSSDATSPTVDLRALEYETTTDENLSCPICRVPLVDPVITKCDHVLCRQCLLQAHAINPVCPVDRSPLTLGTLARNLQKAPKIILNQLDNLKVRCPNKLRGCDMVVARSLIENHVNRYCDKTMVACPHPSCDKLVIKKDEGKGCLHYDVECEYCNETVQKVDLEVHQNTACPNRTKECGHCRNEIIRHKQEEHLKECREAETECKFSSLGCTYQAKRREVDAHSQTCDYRVVGPVGDLVAELRSELKTLREKDRLKERRLKFLENRGPSMLPPSSTEPLADISLNEASTSSESAPYESRDQYFLSLFEAMESKVERMSNGLNELDGRQSMMLFNETVQIKDQLTEIRSTLGVLGMHVRWLMNFRLQERGRTGAAGTGILPGSTGGAASGGSPDASGDLGNFPRRLSDTLRENPPRL